MNLKPLASALIQITAFKTSDGSLFENEEEAQDHEAGMEFWAWFRDEHPSVGEVLERYHVRLKVKGGK